ncbi:hypothetical protein [Hymenobacter fodinae]|uniref:Uncharacterized protein n=1 Tax=Hymenobacter fodinae TaxID=2510796 RepID=A0A4Z0P0M8_9BACT|nr:hypothetical protein [Hymenobacter fodinae]TGE03313.1 hypothetical protein EU556_25695 [Hymenobacter fodinae]
MAQFDSVAHAHHGLRQLLDTGFSAEQVAIESTDGSAPGGPAAHITVHAETAATAHLAASILDLAGALDVRAHPA